MFYETDKNDHGLRYNPLKACVVPRPIGWITTISAAGVVNLAPFSFSKLLICSHLRSDPDQPIEPIAT